MRLTVLGKALVGFVFLACLGFVGWLETLGY